MGQSVKAVLQLILIAAVIAAVVTWGDDRPNWTTWGWRIASPIVSVLLIAILWRASRRKEDLPDVLASKCGHYFERDGLCFGFNTLLQGNLCWLNIWYQNRYQQPCHGRIVLQPAIKSFGIRRLPLQTIDIEVDCDGGACGVCHIPWPVPEKMQGKTVRCEVACETTYPNGRGKLLRFREGIRAGTPSSSVGRAAKTIGFAMVGVISISHPATVRLALPSGAAVEIPPGAEQFSEIIYRPDLPTGGFPVLTQPQQPPVS